MDQYGKFTADIHDGKIVAAYALDRHGIVPAVSKMAFGNRMGVTLDASVEAKKTCSHLHLEIRLLKFRLTSWMD